MDNVKRALPFTKGQDIMHADFGAGTIVDIEAQKIAGVNLELYVIVFPKKKMTIKVPTTGSGLEKLRAAGTTETVDALIAILNGPKKARSRVIWSRRAQDFQADIHSGDIRLVATVVRALYTNPDEDISYSELQLYQEALHLLCDELALILQKDHHEVTAYLEHRCPGKTFTLSSYAPSNVQLTGRKGGRIATPEERKTEPKAAPWTASAQLPKKETVKPAKVKGERKPPTPKARVPEPKRDTVPLRTPRETPVARTYTPPVEAPKKPAPETVIVPQPPVQATPVVVPPVVTTVVERTAPPPAPQKPAMAETPKSLPVEPHVPPVAPKPVSPLEENEVQPIVPPIVPKVTVLAEPTSEVAALREQLEAERKEHAANFSVQAERLQTAEAEAAQAIARAVKAEGRLATVQQDAETRQGTLRDTIDELHDRVEKERGIIRTYEGVIAGLRAKVLQDETERTELLALRDAYAVIQKSKERLDKSLSVVQGKLKEKLEELRTANTALKHLQAKQPEVVSVSTEDVEKLKQELRIARTKSTKAGKKITGLEKELKSLRKDLKETVAQLRATEATLQQLQDERITEMAADSVTPPVTTTELAEAFEYISGLEAQILSLTTALKEVTGQLATANRASERNTTRHERRIAKLSEQLETTKAALKAAEAEVAKAATTIMTRIEAVRAELLFEVEKRVTNSAYEKEELARLRAQFRKSPIQ